MSTYWGIFYFIIMAQKKFTYLMKNTRDGQYKIGESNYPKFREKTLMSQEPVIEIFACFKSEKCNSNLTTGILSFGYLLSGGIKQTEV